MAISLPMKPPAPPKSLLVGIAGGSGSGKTWLARYLLEAFGSSAVLVSQDWYYHDQSRLSPEAQLALNFDHPQAFDNDLFYRDLLTLRGGIAVTRPRYEYSTYRRLSGGVPLEPAALVLVEGLLVLGEQKIRDLFALTVFVDTPADIRLVRRIRRDIVERGLPIDEILRLYEHCVRPMHDQFVQPAAAHADLCWRPLEDAHFPERLRADLAARLG